MNRTFSVRAKNIKQLEAAYKMAYNRNLRYRAEIVMDNNHKSSYIFYVITTKEKFEDFKELYLDAIS